MLQGVTSYTYCNGVKYPYSPYYVYNFWAQLSIEEKLVGPKIVCCKVYLSWLEIYLLNIENIYCVTYIYDQKLYPLLHININHPSNKSLAMNFETDEATYDLESERT